MPNAIRTLISKLRGKKENKYGYRSGWDLGSNGGSAPSSDSPFIRIEDFVVSSEANFPDPGSPAKQKTTDDRIVKKPVEIFQEIVSETKPTVNIANIDGQIAIVKRRKKVLQEELGLAASDEVEALKFLEARKKLIKKQDLFHWPTTTFELIDKLCKKYKVQYVDFSSYYKNVPMEAIDELEKFANAYEQFRDDQPVLKLIVDQGGKETKKDPILLASSPFGKWFHILGAWDKEVEIVDDLIYNGK